ncbi:MAG: tetratricopeptide repeat protein [Thermoguttaceae bacterium]|nr:tetratricopeptide repeat protein [Thermoguttaceae bacterium]MDW8077443.1 tetratricopeptide repeat protein [Thermoguttaceae bacterium]
MISVERKPPGVSDSGPSETSTNAPGNNSPWGTLTQRVLLAVAGVGSVALTVLAATLMWPRPRSQPTLAQALQALQEGEPARALQLLEQLGSGGLPQEAPLGTLPFLRGRTFAALSEQYRGSKRRELLTRAAAELRDAIKLGLQADQLSQARWVFAHVSYQLGHLEDVRDNLTEKDILAAPAAYRPLMALVFADAWAKADPKRVVNFLAGFLQNAAFPAEIEAQLRLREAWALARAEMWDQATAVCQKVDKDSPYFPRAKLLEGLILISRVRAEAPQGERTRAWANAGKPAPDEQLVAAMTALAEAIRWDNLTSRVTSEALYWLGVAQAEAGDYQAAEQTWRRTVERAGPQLPAVAAAWALGQVALERGRSSAAADWFTRAVELAGEATHPQGFQLLDWDRWMIGPQLEAEILRAYRHFLDNAEFALALTFAESLKGHVDARLHLRMKAEALWKAGEYGLARDSGPSSQSRTEQQSATSTPPKSQTVANPRQYFRQAGVVLLELAARSYTEREYPDHLWMAAECFRKGRSARGVLQALAHYMQDQPIKRRPWALLYRGEALLALGQIEAALRDLEACYLNFPRDSAAFEARVLAAQALSELGKVEEAEALLRRNLDGQELTPASKEWRQSLLELGQLLLGKGDAEAAADYLAEAVQRYPNHPEALLARYLWGYAKLRQAHQIQSEANKEPLPAVAAERRQKASELCRQAAEILGPIQAKISRGGNLDLALAEQKLLLRNARAAELMAHIGSGNIPAANAIAQQILKEADQTPEAAFLVACVMATQGTTGESPESRSLLQQLLKLCDRVGSSGGESSFSPNLSFWKTLIAQMLGP